MSIDLAGCVGKRPYQTWWQAKRGAIRVNRKEGRHGHVEPYRCKGCGHWHLGSVDPIYRRQQRRTTEEA